MGCKAPTIKPKDAVKPPPPPPPPAKRLICEDGKLIQWLMRKINK